MPADDERPNHQSSQERIIAGLSERCVGGRLVFRPDPWPKGSTGTREPADLIWSTNGVVLLMSMKSGDGAVKKKNQDKSLRQLKGGLREWRSGRRLTGFNGATRFDLAYDAKAHVVLLSLVEADDLPVTSHSAMAERLGVAIVATAPEALLHRLIYRRGTSRDLIEVLLAVDRAGGEVTGAQVIEMLDSMHARAYVESSFGRQPLNRTDPLSNAQVQFVEALRGSAGGQDRVTDVGAPAAFGLGATMDDLGWSGLFTVLGALHNPTSPRLFRPLDADLAAMQAGVIALVGAVKGAGADIVGVSTYAPPPPGVELWPPDYLDNVEVHRVENHTLVLGRVARMSDSRFHRRWAECWADAQSQAQVGTPPVGLILHLSSVGVGYAFCGMSGTRASATHRLMTQHFRSEAPC
jgi:hypothetical protein